MDDRFDDLIEAAQLKLQAGETMTKDEANAYMAQGLFNPTNQVYFRAGLIACREYMARFVEAQSPEIAASIRANWWPAKLGEDLGPPRLMRWDELTEGEYGTADFKVREGISPTLEALPIAHQFLQTASEPPSNAVIRMPLTEQPDGVPGTVKGASVADMDELRWIVNGFLEWHEGGKCPADLIERARAAVPNLDAPEPCSHCGECKPWVGLCDRMGDLCGKAAAREYTSGARMNATQVADNSRAVAAWKKGASNMVAHWKANGPTVEAQWCTHAAQLLSMGSELMPAGVPVGAGQTQPPSDADQSSPTQGSEGGA